MLREYRGFSGSNRWSGEEGVFYGEVISGQEDSDLVAYTAPSADGLQWAFENEVDRYLKNLGYSISVRPSQLVAAYSDSTFRNRPLCLKLKTEGQDETFLLTKKDTLALFEALKILVPLLTMEERCAVSNDHPV